MRIYAGELPDTRRDKRRVALLDAATELVHASGYERLAVRRVCQQARLNDRYFYESFSTVDELLIACFDRAIEDTLGVLITALADADPDVTAHARAVVRTTLAHLLQDRAATSVMLAGRSSPALAPRRRALIARVTELFLAQSAVLTSHDDRSAAHRLGALALVNGELETVCMWLEGEVAASTDEVIDHVTEAITDRLQRAGIR